MMEMINNGRGLYQATPHLNNNELIRSPLMSKIYIDPLNLGPILIDRNDMSDHEPFDDRNYSGEDNAFYGKTHSEETKKQISRALTGIPFTLERRKNISEAGKRRIATPENRANNSKAKMGRTLSAETRKKVSDARKGMVFTEEHKRHLSEAAIRRWKK